jgi:hypothetical protein
MKVERMSGTGYVRLRCESVEESRVAQLAVLAECAEAVYLHGEQRGMIFSAVSGPLVLDAIERRMQALGAGAPPFNPANAEVIEIAPGPKQGSAHDG